MLVLELITFHYTLLRKFIRNIIYETSIIYSYRMKQAMTNNLLQSNHTEKENLICKGIVCAVDMHRKAIKLVFVI